MTFEVQLASPRGFCAGVDRAIEIVELVLEVYGKPVYVRHEIVHNRHVVESLRAQGRDLHRRPGRRSPTAAWSIFSAHGIVAGGARRGRSAASCARSTPPVRW